MGTLLKVVGVLVGLFLVYAVWFAHDPDSQAKANAREAIDRCRATVADDLLPRDARLFARGACERMEADFRDKYRASP